MQHGQAISTNTCNACKCVFGATVCTERPSCDPDTSTRCKFGDNLYIPVGEFRQTDGRECQCLETGQIICEEKVEISDSSSCETEDGRVVLNGLSVRVDCNTCKCLSGRLLCTKRFCEPVFPDVSYKGCRVDDVMLVNGQSYGDCVCSKGELICTETKESNSEYETGIIPEVRYKDCRLDDMMIENGQSYGNCVCTKGKLVCTETIESNSEYETGIIPDVRYKDCRLDDMMIENGKSYGDCVCTDGDLICREVIETSTDEDTRRSCGTLDDGRMVFIGSTVRTADGRDCTCSDSGSFITCTSDKTCEFEGRRVPVGQITEKCFCMYTGMVQCTSSGFVGGGGVWTDQVSGISGSSFGMLQAGSTTEISGTSQEQFSVSSPFKDSVITRNPGGADFISLKVCGTLSDGRQVRIGETVTDTNGQTCKCSDTGNFLECYSTGTVCPYKGGSYPVGQIDDRCSCLNSGAVVCNGALDPFVDIKRTGLNTQSGADSSLRVCGSLSDGRQVRIGETVTDINGQTCKCSDTGNFLECYSTGTVCPYKGGSYPVGQIDNRCSCLNSGAVVCNGALDPFVDIKRTGDSNPDQDQIGGQVQGMTMAGSDFQGYSDGSCRMGDIMYYNGQFIGYGQGTEKCLCQNGKISCTEDTSEGCPLENGALLPEGQSVQISLYTCLCKNKRLTCSLSRSCFYLGTEIANGQVVMNNGQKCVCLEKKMMCYPVGSCFQGGRVLTEGQSVVSGTGQYCTCSNGDLACVVTEVYCEVGSLGGSGRLQVGQVIKLGGKDCTCTRTGLQCSETTAYCEFSVPSGETYRLARDTQKIIAGVGKCTCKADGPVCLQGCFLRDLELEDGETVLSEGEICTCNSNKLTCRAGYTCYIEGDVTLLTGQRSGRCKCGVGELSCEGLVGWEVQGACVSKNMVVQEGVTVPYRCGFCKCSRGVLGCYQVNC